MKQKVQIKTPVFHITIRGWLIGYTGGVLGSWHHQQKMGLFTFVSCTSCIGLCYICFLSLVGFFFQGIFCPSLWLPGLSQDPLYDARKSFCLLYRHQFQWSLSSKPLPFCCDTPASGKMEEPAWPQSRKPRGLWKKDFEQFVVWGDRCECGAGWFIEVRGELKRPTRS